MDDQVSLGTGFLGLEEISGVIQIDLAHLLGEGIEMGQLGAEDFGQLLGKCLELLFAEVRAEVLNDAAEDALLMGVDGLSEFFGVVHLLGDLSGKLAHDHSPLLARSGLCCVPWGDWRVVFQLVSVQSKAGANLSHLFFLAALRMGG